MPKPTFQRSVITRVLNAAPELRYVAVYHTSDDWLPSCIHNYQDRAFVYVLSKDHECGEFILYAGKSKAQYARLLRHMQKFAFDHAYIFECQPERLNAAEADVIAELAPMYNRIHNPHRHRMQQILEIDLSVVKDEATIHQDLARKLDYESNICLYGFSLPGAVFRVLEQQAKDTNRTCSELLQTILETVYTKEIARQTRCSNAAQTNLVSAATYGKLNGKSREQVMQYCHKNRIPGAFRVGRDWVMPSDARFPDDHRRCGAK